MKHKKIKNSNGQKSFFNWTEIIVKLLWTFRHDHDLLFTNVGKAKAFLPDQMKRPSRVVCTASRTHQTWWVKEFNSWWYSHSSEIFAKFDSFGYYLCLKEILTTLNRPVFNGPQVKFIFSYKLIIQMISQIHIKLVMKFQFEYSSIFSKPRCVVAWQKLWRTPIWILVPK